MKLLLTSSNFTTEEIISKTEEMVEKPRNKISMAVINEAYSVEDDNFRWVVDDLNRVYKNFGGNLEFVNLLALDLKTVKMRIMRNDAIFVVGGHTDYLMSVFNKTGFAKLLPELLKTKLYIGSSAGSMVMGKRLSTEAYKVFYSERENFGISKYMKFVDFSIMPHMDSQYFPLRKSNLIEAAKVTKHPIYGIRDDTAIVVDGNKLKVIGSESYIVG